MNTYIKNMTTTLEKAEWVLNQKLVTVVVHNPRNFTCCVQQTFCVNQEPETQTFRHVIADINMVFRSETGLLFPNLLYFCHRRINPSDRAAVAIIAIEENDTTVLNYWSC